MITLPSKRDQEKVLEAYRNLRGYSANIVLLIGGEDWSGAFKEGAWGQDAHPIHLDATISGRLPRRLEGEIVELFCEVKGVVVSQLFGERTETNLPTGEARSSGLLSWSPGALAYGEDAISLGEETEYPHETSGNEPHQIAFDALRRLPYDLSLIEVEPVPGLPLTYAGQQKFLASEKVGDVLSRLEEDAFYLFRDTSDRGVRAFTPLPLGATQGEEESYEASELPDWFENRPEPQGLRFDRVRVWKPRADGTLAFEVFEDIEHMGEGRPPHRGRTKDVPLEAASEDGPEEAQRRARREAFDLARKPHANDFYLPTFHPLCQTQDRMRVTESYKHEGVSWETLWGLRREAYEHEFGGGSEGGLIATRVACSAVVLDEEQIQVPALLMPSGSSGIIFTIGPPVGVSTGGVWINWTFAVTSGGIPWAGADVEGRWIDPELSGGYLGADAIGRWMEV